MMAFFSWLLSGAITYHLEKWWSESQWEGWHPFFVKWKIKKRHVWNHQADVFFIIESSYQSKIHPIIQSWSHWIQSYLLRKWDWGIIYYNLEGFLYLLRQWPWIHREFVIPSFRISTGCPGHSLASAGPEAIRCNGPRRRSSTEPTGAWGAARWNTGRVTSSCFLLIPWESH